MSLQTWRCGSCGRTAFPDRLLCPDCGARDWHEQPVDSGVLESVAQQGEVRIGIVRTPPGALAVVRVEGDAREGDQVTLAQDGEVPVARR
ncbi:MAG: PhlB family protein [Solirubrobacteraceae bacterium]